jgi:hypothetical protein
MRCNFLLLDTWLVKILGIVGSQMDAIFFFPIVGILIGF